MSYVSIRAAIQGLIYGWPNAPIAWDNAPTPKEALEAQSNGDPWVALTILPGTTITASIGSSPNVRQTGLIAVQVFVKPDTGTIAAYELCDSLAALLQHKQSGALETLALSVTRTGEMNGYFQLNATVPYRYN
ncbi:hypothetical protein ELY33_17190 [Vreelandella andesensis]|uniref:DUF3168 domain-containing protein n=1 Tax=Vreelandella andesensis TaxID=447567 RepID=A0A433KF17_9GAMM|nr:phage tail terminator-like protein [Halomonas andesensis]RUR26843.1 hypothetical protein ELY33_17190 [Halomonas andesensis]